MGFAEARAWETGDARRRKAFGGSGLMNGQANRALGGNTESPEGNPAWRTPCQAK